jgi:hypothetical protein
MPDLICPHSHLCRGLFKLLFLAFPARGFPHAYAGYIRHIPHLAKKCFFVKMRYVQCPVQGVGAFGIQKQNVRHGMPQTFVLTTIRMAQVRLAWTDGLEL